MDIITPNLPLGIKGYYPPQQQSGELTTTRFNKDGQLFATLPVLLL